MLSFGELYARIPKGERSAKAALAVALYVLDALDAGTARGTGDAAELVRLNLGKTNAPKNATNILTTAGPEVEPVPNEGREKRWRLTRTGVEWLESLTETTLVRSADPGFTYQLADLHPGIRRAAEELFLGRHYPEAVGRAAKWLNLAVRQKAGRLRDEGVQMMHQVFSPDKGRTTRLLVGDLREDWQRDRQDGLRSLFAGMQAAILNVDKHGDLGIIDPASAMEQLCMLSFLAKQLERCQGVEPD